MSTALEFWIWIHSKAPQTLGEDMKYVTELPVDGADGTLRTVSIEIDQADDGLVDASIRSQAATRATRSLGEMLAGVRPVAENFLDGFTGMANAPDEIALEFGLSVSANANLYIATTAAQSNFKVSLAWHKLPATQPVRPRPEAAACPD
jgi:hypothetical protein